MPKIGLARNGEPLTIKHSEVKFSVWPVGRTVRRFRLQSQVFVADVWPLIADAVETKCPKDTRKAAHAFRRQSEDYFKAASLGGLTAARPVLLYYSFLNLAKAFTLTKGVTHLLGRAGHGIAEAVAGRAIPGAKISVYPSKQTKPQIFDEFLNAVSGKKLKKKTELTFGNLLAQILPGHRLWCYAAGKSERFVALKRIDFLHNPKLREMWLRMAVSREDLAKSYVSHVRFLKETGLSRHWREVRDPDDTDADDLWVEQTQPIAYGHRAGDHLRDVVADVRPLIWQTVLSIPPYRRHYLFMCPDGSRGDLLPQLLSMYAVVFFLGSITRYYPEHFERIIHSTYGPHVEALLSEAPMQFLYLLTSELLERDVSKPSII